MVFFIKSMYIGAKQSLKFELKCSLFAVLLAVEKSVFECHLLVPSLQLFNRQLLRNLISSIFIAENRYCSRRCVLTSVTVFETRLDVTHVQGDFCGFNKNPSHMRHPFR